ncbi:MAG TPA: hypothetical protein VN176_07285 [Verrucomicrobiae bacterium]|jgi:hypothetical protein|nr:hypothetical protein [Verrucomicrobiae bacterium]
MKHDDGRSKLQKTCRAAALPGVVWAGLLNSAATQDQFTVSSCPGQAKIPVTFQIDCSHLTDAATKQLCRPFIDNQACKVFPVYRNITGINLEDTCKSIKFTIYEDSNWPHPKGEGGLALNCAVDYLAKYSVQGHPNSKIGPYDVHELLHEYQIALGALPDAHVLFSSSMAEAIRQLGESGEYERAMKNMKAEAPRLEQDLRSGKITGPRQCTAAETQVEESLYIENSRSVYAFYRKLEVSRNSSQADREARFNRMFYLVSGPKPEVRKFLLDNGCSKF